MFKELAESKGIFADKPEEAFLRIQGDLEWIYAIRNPDNPDTASLEIFRTSNPNFLSVDRRGVPVPNKNTRLAEHPVEFVFSAWYSYVQFFPDLPAKEMADVEMSCGISLRCLEAFAEAMASARGSK